MPADQTLWRDTLRGMAAMSVAVSVFAINDALTKLANLPTGETMAIRSAIAGALLFAVIAASGQLHLFRTLMNRAVVIRTIGDVVATVLFLLALFQIPLSNALTIVQVTPLAITAAASVVLREQVGWRRWSAVAAGFLGVVIVVHPGLAGFQAASLLTLLSVVGITARDLSTRFIPAAVPGLLVTLIASFANSLAGFGVGLFETWTPPPALALLELLGSGAFLSLGHELTIFAMRHGEMSAIAPFRYVAIPLAIVLGFLIWGDQPDVFTLIGTALIIAAGVYTFARERALHLAVPGEASLPDI